MFVRLHSVPSQMPMRLLLEYLLQQGLCGARPVIFLGFDHGIALPEAEWQAQKQMMDPPLLMYFGAHLQVHELTEEELHDWIHRQTVFPVSA